MNDRTNSERFPDSRCSPPCWLAQTGTAEAKPYKGAEVYSLESVLYGRMEMRMRMIRGSGLLSTFFTYKNGSEMSRRDLGRAGHRGSRQE